MAEEILASVQVRRDSKANWEAANPVLLDGEAAYEKDTDMFKIGDGVNSYNNLSYHNKVGPKGDTGAQGPQGEPGASVEVDDTLSKTGAAADAKATGDALNALNEAKANNADLATVAKSGSYTDLTDKPTIPAAYTLPIASATQLGGVMPVAKTDEMTQAVGVDESGGLWALPGGGAAAPAGYELLLDVTLEAESPHVSQTFPEPTSFTDLYIMIAQVGTENVSNTSMHWYFALKPFIAGTWGVESLGMNLYPSNDPNVTKFYIAHIKLTDGMVYIEDAVIDGTTGSSDLFDVFKKTSSNNLNTNTYTKYNRARPLNVLSTYDGTRKLEGIAVSNWGRGVQPAGIGSTFKVWGVRG